jgi:isoleucyl-tRNA synthetase
VAGVVKDVLIPLWNAYSFFVTYANIDGWTPAHLTGKKSPNELDRWILSLVEKLIEDVTSAMEKYDLQQAVRPFVAFIDQLTNWYIRRSRRRFWKSQNDEDKIQAYETLYTVLIEVSKIIAPFVPFIAESIYRNLRVESMPESVHLSSFPVTGKINREPELEEKMSQVTRIVRLGRSLRVKHGLKIRQPLSSICIVSLDRTIREKIEWGKTLILEELNVKDVRFEHDDSSLATYKAKPNFKVLGPKFATSASRIAQAITELEEKDIRTLANGLSVSIELDGMKLELMPEDVIVEKTGLPGIVVATDADLVVALDTTLTNELIEEGLAREFVHVVQNLRKEKEFEISQRIQIKTFVDDEVATAIDKHKQYIMSETLATSCVIEKQKPAEAYELKLNGHPVAISISPV